MKLRPAAWTPIAGFFAWWWLAQIVGFCPAQGSAQKKSPANFEKDIRSLEAGRVKTLSTKTILFTGSSSIRKWDLKKEFPGLETVNLGFGGSRMADLNAFASRILFPCSPTRMVVYEGDNDLHEGASPREVIRDFEQFLAKVAGSLPETRIYFLAVKPSPSRLKEMDQQKEFNRLLRGLCEQSRGKAIFVDTFTPILGPDGNPDPSLFLEDKLHLNDKGYSRWKTTLEPLLK